MKKIHNIARLIIENMKFYTKNILLLLIIFFSSCKKEDAKTKEYLETKLPNFGNVELPNITEHQSMDDPAISVINSYYHTIWEEGNLWGGVLVGRGDEILFENYRGFTQNNSQEAINKNTALHVASVSKTMTAMAILKLVESGKLNLNDDITKFFPQFPYLNVSVKSLLSQRSGLPKYEYFIDKIIPIPAEISKPYLSNQDILNMLIKYKPEMARMPETGFMYCNTNYVLLALIIEKITGTQFPVAMKQMIFKPLKMNHTYILEKHKMEKAAKSFYQRGAKVYPYDRLDLIYGDKNVFTTPRDLFNFSRAMYREGFLKKEIMNQVFQPYSNEKPGMNNYGLGFRIKLFDNQNKLTYHNGWWHGTNSVFAHLQHSKVTIIAIGNKYSQSVYSALALSSLFENFPYEAEKLMKILNDKNNPKSSDN